MTTTGTGQGAWVQGGFASEYFGTIAICGETTESGSATVRIQTSNDDFSTTPTTVYDKNWTSAALGLTNSCKPLASDPGAEYVRVIANYSSGGGLSIYVDAISIYVGSYAYAFYGTSHTGMGSVSFSDNALQVNDSKVADLTAPSSGSTGTLVLDLGTHYGGRLVLNVGSASYSSTIDIEVSPTGGVGSYTTSDTFSVAAGGVGAAEWQTADVALFNNDKYVGITETYAGHPVTLYVDAIYVT
jgi:hypothetical protein